MRNLLSLLFATVALALLASPVGAANLVTAPEVPGVDDNPLDNPWGFDDGQVISREQAREVLLYGANVQRMARGLQPLYLADSSPGADCNTAAVITRGQFGHWTEDCPGRHISADHSPDAPGVSGGEVVAGDGNNHSPTSVVGLWTRSTAGHNAWLYAPLANLAEVSLRCATIGPYGMANVATMRIGNNDPTIAVNVTAPAFDASMVSTPFGPGCDVEGNIRFRYWKGYDDVLDWDEAAPSQQAPELWHRFQIARLYDAYFGRYPDAGGWQYWIERHLRSNWLDGWYYPQTSLFRMSDYFADSPEFKAMYGANLTNTEFIELVYNNILDRAPDAGGIAYWTDRMDNQGLSRGELMVFFSESIEYIGLAAPSISGDCWNGNVSSSYLCAAPWTPHPFPRSASDS